VVARCDPGGPRRTRRRAACCTSKAASPALCKTLDSETQRAETIGFEVQDSSLAWGCRSGCPIRIQVSLASHRRSEALFAVTEVPSKALFLPRPMVATVRRECALAVRRPQRAPQPAASLSFERSREMTTGRATEQRRHQRRPCCPVCAPLFGAAGQSNFQILRAAACLDSETTGRTSRAQYPDASPLSR